MAAQFFDLVDDFDQIPPKRDAIEQGATFVWNVTFYASDVSGTTGSDWLARMQIRSGPADMVSTVVAEMTSDDGEITVAVVDDATYGAGVRLDFMLDAAVTERIAFGRYRYDVELVRNGYVRRILQGRAQVTGEVTRG